MMVFYFIDLENIIKATQKQGFKYYTSIVYE